MSGQCGTLPNCGLTATLDRDDGIGRTGGTIFPFLTEDFLLLLEPHLSEAIKARQAKFARDIVELIHAEALEVAALIKR